MTSRVGTKLSVGAIFIVLIVVFLTYSSSPLRYTERIMNMGEEKIYAGEYATALSCFNEAYRIGNGKNNCIREIKGKLERIMDYVDTSDNEEETIRITDTVISFCENKFPFEDILRRAESAEYEIHMKQIYEADEKTIEKINDLLDKESWDDIADMLRSELSAGMGEETIDKRWTRDKYGMTVLIKRVSHGTALICIKQDNNNQEYVTAIIASGITNALYEGGWQDDYPNGEGKLSIWNDTENYKKATVITGDFSDGKMNGTMNLSSMGMEEVTLQVENGKIQAISRNKEGELWVIENIDTVTRDYIAGVPGFGGSDNKLLVRK